MAIKESRLPVAVQHELRNLRAYKAEQEDRANQQVKGRPIVLDFYSDTPLGLPNETVSYLLDGGARVDVHMKAHIHNSKRGTALLHLTCSGGTLRITPHVANAISIEVIR